MRNLGITPGSKGRPSLGAAATPASTSKEGAAAADGSAPTPAAADAGDAAATPAADGAAAGPSSSSEQQQPDERSSGLRAAAAAALAAAKEGALGGVVSNYNKVTLKETRRFAGKDIEVCYVTLLLSKNEFRLLYLRLVQISWALLSDECAWLLHRQGTTPVQCRLRCAALSLRVELHVGKDSKAAAAVV
jgi:hypothetical protein